MAKKVNPKLLLLAFAFLAVLCFVVGVSMTEKRLYLLGGETAAGVVVRIDSGIKGLKSVEAEYFTLANHKVVGRDIHKTQNPRSINMVLGSRR